MNRQTKIGQSVPAGSETEHVPAARKDRIGREETGEHAEDGASNSRVPSRFDHDFTSIPAQSYGVKRDDASPEAVKEELGTGRSLEGAVASRMASSTGSRFAHLRIHTDTTAAAFASRLNARAFTVGNHVAFGRGEYRPGTLVGGALLAHELAHSAQQGMATGSPTVSDGALERDADRSAVGTLLALGRKGGTFLSQVSESAAPRLRSGLRLSRCTRDDNPVGTGVHYDQALNEMLEGSPRDRLAALYPTATMDASADRDEILAHLRDMSPGGVYVFAGHGAYPTGSRTAVGINPASGATVMGAEIAAAVGDESPPTVVIMCACGSSALLPDVTGGGVPIAAGFSSNLSLFVAMGATVVFMERLGAGDTFLEAQRVTNLRIARAGRRGGFLGVTTGTLDIRYLPGYSSSMTLARARAAHRGSP